MSQTTPLAPEPKKSTLVTGLLFVFCAIPGLVLFLSSSALLFAAFFDPGPNLPHPVVTAGIAFVAMALMLVGVGKVKQWGYSFVFLAIPISLFTYFLFDSNGGGGKLFPGIFSGFSAIAALSLVRRSYQRDRKSTSRKTRESTDS